MSTPAHDILRDALTLDVVQRADLAAALLESLDDETDRPSESAWLVELERRARRALAGQSAGRPWDEVREQLAASLTTR